VCVHGTVRPRCELSLDTLYRLKLRRFFFFGPVATFHKHYLKWNLNLSLTVLPHVIAIIVIIIVVMTLVCLGILFSNLTLLLHLTSEGISLHERDGFHVLCKYRCNSECQPFTLLNEIGSAHYRSWAVTLFVFVINSEFMQNFQLMPCHIAFEVLSKLTVRLRFYCSDPFICAMRAGDT